MHYCNTQIVTQLQKTLVCEANSKDNSNTCIHYLSGEANLL